MRGVIATIGMFDGVHIGHRHILHTLAEKGKELSLTPWVFTFDRHPRQVLYGADSVRLLNTFDERLALIKSFAEVELTVIPFSVETASLSACTFFSSYMAQQADIKALLLGYDNSFGNKRNNDMPQLRQMLDERSIAVLDDVPVMCHDVEVSSTKIRQALELGDVSVANEMLGYRYSLSGLVAHGRQIGRRMGLPTANVDCAACGKLLPADGVYAVSALVDGIAYNGVANLGMQPTVNGSDRSLEVHLIDASPDIYGAYMSVQFVKRLRDIRRFNSLDRLAGQIESDIAQTKTLFSVTCESSMRK